MIARIKKSLAKPLPVFLPIRTLNPPITIAGHHKGLAKVIYRPIVLSTKKSVRGPGNSNKSKKGMPESDRIAANRLRAQILKSLIIFIVPSKNQKIPLVRD